jgi:hypothetical protein
MTPSSLALVLLALSQSVASNPGPASPPPPAAILGQWESAVRNKGGVGNILEFHPDGRVTQISAAMGDTTYEVKGEWLRTFYKDEETGQERESDLIVEFEGSDRFAEKGEDGAAQSWSDRMGPPPPRGASPLVGQWCSIFMELLTQYRQFTPDGKLFVRMPAVTLRGKYQVDGDMLTVEIFGQPSGRYPFRIENGQLIIKSRDGSDRVYKRTECTLLKGY